MSKSELRASFFVTFLVESFELRALLKPTSEKHVSMCVLVGYGAAILEVDFIQIH
jgi:hypothetical protein